MRNATRDAIALAVMAVVATGLAFGLYSGIAVASEPAARVVAAPFSEVADIDGAGERVEAALGEDPDGAEPEPSSIDGDADMGESPEIPSGETACSYEEPAIACEEPGNGCQAPAYGYAPSDGLTREGGVNAFGGRTETWYSSNVLYHVDTPEWSLDGEGFYRDSEGRYVVAASDMEPGTVFEGSKGECVVLDAGCAPGITDYYVAW